MKNDEAIKVFETYLTTGHVPYPYELCEAAKAAIITLSSYEQMMKEAVEGYVNYYEDSGGKLMAEAQVGCPYHIGDKVKIIVIKKEENK